MAGWAVQPDCCRQAAPARERHCGWACRQQLAPALAAGYLTAPCPARRLSWTTGVPRHLPPLSGQCPDPRCCTRLAAGFFPSCGVLPHQGLQAGGGGAGAGRPAGPPLLPVPWRRRALHQQPGAQAPPDGRAGGDGQADGRHGGHVGWVGTAGCTCGGAARAGAAPAAVQLAQRRRRRLLACPCNAQATRYQLRSPPAPPDPFFPQAGCTSRASTSC